MIVVTWHGRSGHTFDLFGYFEVVLYDLEELIPFYLAVFGEVHEVHQIIEFAFGQFFLVVESVVEILCQLSELFKGEVLLTLLGTVEFHELTDLLLDIHSLHCLR